MTDVQALERVALGSAMAGAVEQVAEHISSGDFLDPRHVLLFAHVVGAWADGQPTEPVALAHRLAAAGELDAVGGGAYLAEVCEAAQPASAGWYAAQIRDAAQLRQAEADAIRLRQIAEAGDVGKLHAIQGDLAERWTAPRAGRSNRTVDLTPYLTGTYSPPQPTIGGQRDDGVRLMYPGRWHTLIGLTTAGKSMLAAWHVREHILAGGYVYYAHFEEAVPAGTVDRLLQMGLTVEQIREHFRWLDCTKRWTSAEYRAEMAVRPLATFGVLDGINAACAQHGWPVDKPEAVGEYRALFVTPATQIGAAVLSLGHPPKSRDRQGERHGFGSTAWLDEVDGVGMRLEAAKGSPIRKGCRGHSALYVVKDRYGEVERHGSIDAERESGWYYMGALTVDNRDGASITASLTVPVLSQDGAARDRLDVLGDAILYHLVRCGGRFESAKRLCELLRGRRVEFNDHDVNPALERLADAGRIEWPRVSSGRPRPGWVIDTEVPDV